MEHLFIWISVLILYELQNFTKFCVRQLKKWRVANWKIAEGVVYDVDWKRGWKVNPFYVFAPLKLELRYSYEVDGVQYRGHVKTEPWDIDTRSALRLWGDLMDKKIYIRYKPNAPARSTWVSSDGGSGDLAAPAKLDPATGCLLLSFK